MVHLAAFHFVRQIGVFFCVNFHSGLVLSDVTKDALDLDLVVADIGVHVLNSFKTTLGFRINLKRTLLFKISLALGSTQAARVADTVDC